MDTFFLLRTVYCTTLDQPTRSFMLVREVGFASTCPFWVTCNIPSFTLCLLRLLSFCLPIIVALSSPLYILALACVSSFFFPLCAFVYARFIFLSFRLLFYSNLILALLYSQAHIFVLMAPKNCLRPS